MPFHKEPPASFGRERRPCALGRSQGFQLRAPCQPWYAVLGPVPTKPAPACPGEREAREQCKRCSLPNPLQFQPAPGSFEVLGQKTWPVLMLRFFSMSLWYSSSLSLSVCLCVWKAEQCKSKSTGFGSR